MCISKSKHIPYVGAHSKEHNDTKVLSVSCRVHGSLGLTGGMYRSKRAYNGHFHHDLKKYNSYANEKSM